MSKGYIFSLGSAIMLGLSAQSDAFTIALDYSYDTENFFGSGNVDGQGAAAKAAIEAAARFYEGIIGDTLSAIQSSGINTWTASFFHPGTGAVESIENLVVAEDTIIIYAGGRTLSGATLGQGGSGGYSSSGTSDWNTTVATRGQGKDVSEDFSLWGGSITFNNTAGLWHYDYTSTLGLDSNESDFYSVVLHEMGHVLGIGGSSAWRSHISNGEFTGAYTVASYGGNAPIYAGDSAHWAEGTMSVVYGGSAAQEAMMDPSITTGTRKVATQLDVAALKDIGWSIAVPEPQVSFLFAFSSLALCFYRKKE